MKTAPLADVGSEGDICKRFMQFVGADSFAALSPSLRNLSAAKPLPY